MRRCAQRGFTYVWVVMAIGVLGVALAALGQTWADDARRQRERELLRVGVLYAVAIDNYYRMSPGSVKRYPATLDDLLLDRRFTGTLRHLRRLYPDPIAPDRPWGLLRAEDGGVRGVFSNSAQQPMRRAFLQIGSVSLPPASRYSEWKFFVQSN